MRGRVRTTGSRLLFLLFLAILALPPSAAPSLARSPASAGLPAELPTAPPVQAVYPLLYPDDLDPPEACHVPRMAAFGQDLEVMLGPWVNPSPLTRLNQPPAWQLEAAFPAALASSDVDAIALTSETILAAWLGQTDGRVYLATWGTEAGWAVASLGDEPASGKPALLSRSPIHWAAFARFANTIRVIEWYNGSLGAWQELPGVSGVASDPVVISNDPGRMSVFYRTGDGTVMFTEWEGAWLSPSVALSGPLMAAGPQGIASDLAVVSRNDHHLAVIGVDAGNQLWVRERTDWNEPDWSDTRWVKLMDGVQIARPAAASRHANHAGIVVKDTAGQPYYIGWAYQAPFTIHLPVVSKAYTPGGPDGLTGGLYGARPTAYFPALGWKEPVALGSASFASPMTLVARTSGALSVLGVRPDGNLYEMVWTEDTGWGSWQSIAGPGLRTNQSLAVALRHMDDVFLLGRYAGTGQVWSKHYTNVDETVLDEDLGLPLSGLPRAQALALVDARTVWVAVTREVVSGTWQISAREISANANVSLDLAHGDSGQTSDRIAVAAADVDVDGKDEVVVATLRQGLATIDVSILHLFFPTSNTLAITTTATTWDGLAADGDVNVTVGDLNADGARDEVIISYLAVTETHVGIFEASTSGLVLRNSAVLPSYWDGYCRTHWNDCAVVDRDLETAAGQIFYTYMGTPLAGDQLVLLDVSHLLGYCIANPSDPSCAGICPDPGNLKCVDYAQDHVQTLSLDPLTWSLDPLHACSYLDPVDSPGISSTIAADPYTSALDTGDMEADGLAEIVYSWDERLVSIVDIAGFPTPTCSFSVLDGQPNRERSLAVGDVDRDGRAEAAAGYGVSGSTDVGLVDMVDGQVLRTVGQFTASGQRAVLAGDMDGDTSVAELAGCKTFAEARVVAVVNGAPRWYADGQPIQDTGALFGRTYGSGGGTSDGTTTQFGASVGLGVAVEINVPLAGVRLSEFRAAVTQEFMGALGHTTTIISSQTREEGYQYAGSSLGMVVYNSVDYICYYYDVYQSDTPANTSRVMACMPTGAPVTEDFKPLEDWHATSFRQTAGPSWVDVGHRTPAGLHSNDLDEAGNYGGVLPINGSQLKYTWPITAPIRISYSSQGGFENYWGISDMWGGEQEDTSSFEENTILSFGLTLGIVNIDGTGNFGLGWEESTVTSWEQTLEMGGSVAKFMDNTRLCYTVVPYVYHARARTAAGVAYPYLEMDYYVPWRGPCALEGEPGEVPVVVRGPLPE